MAEAKRVVESYYLIEEDPTERHYSTFTGAHHAAMGRLSGGESAVVAERRTYEDGEDVSMNRTELRIGAQPRLLEGRRAL